MPFEIVPASDCPINKHYKRYTTNGKKLSVKEKFYDHVAITNDKDCWEWQYSTHCGYGVFYYRGRNVPAHRFAYILEYGDIPEGKEICHKCNNKKCVNPKHLYAGTHAENMQDSRVTSRTDEVIHGISNKLIINWRNKLDKS